MYIEESLQLQNKLLTTLVTGGGLKELVESLSNFIEKGVIITNPSYRVLHSTLSNESLKPGDSLDVLALNPPVPGRVLILAGEEGLEALALELSHDSKRLGFLFICNPGTDDDHRLKVLTHQARNLYVIEMQKQEELLETGRHYQDAFLFDLFYGNMEDNEDIISRARLWGWDFAQPYVVTVFELEDYEAYSEDHYLVSSLYDIIQSIVQPLDRSVILMKKNEEVILALPIEEKKRRDDKAFINMIINQVLAQVDERIVSRRVRVGTGRKYDQPTELFRSYQEAKVAVKLSVLLKGKGNMTYFRDLGVERILYNHDKQELLEFYREILADLEAQDKQKNELVETLENYLSHHCDLKATATALFLHPNSLRYRLKRIEEILDVNLEDFDIIVALIIAFKIKHLIGFKEKLSATIYRSSKMSALAIVMRPVGYYPLWRMES
ncbi:sugar diacid utilization regulator [Desulfitobacterium dichloroeliminans LMG P-21439]|uniref:Sugar diacid utilization regulator n=1 Tax=Desulfitobacterium dichloroeliminans (strain LMG P-21439 / DCA1) TaxID=871963 RepID=L0FCN6_DESDL|nr:helix-turn-helix domain-containing protein [Desulfitobacterium dichloroeliminans]AGA70708.1 sugar diacid utilization regulator [Desulfitobacterium dichloroeliminans LMG P-21439]